MSISDGGKGSSPRPFSVTNEEYSKRWDAIFGKDKQEDVCPKCGSEEFDTHVWSSSQGVTPYDDWCQCGSCKHEWSKK